MTYIQLFITLKIPDNVARTALHTVQTRLRYPELKDLRRSEFWELDYPELDAAVARSLTESFVVKTAYFMNPNKHIWAMYDSQTSIQDLDKMKSPFAADARLLVCDRVDGQAESTLEALQALSKECNQPYEVQRGIWWDLRFEGFSVEEIRKTTDDLAITRSRMHGIFANPHYQTCRVFYT